jgi:hypothetical protein
MKKLYLTLALVPVMSFLSGFSQNPRNILIDDVTATGCSHCACMDSVINRVILNRHPNTIVLGIQGPSSLFYLPQFDSLMWALNFQSTGALVNRQGNEIPVDAIADSVDGRYAFSVQSPVKIRVVSKTYQPVTRMIDISVEATSLMANLQGIFRINLAVVENHLMGPQQHDPGCPGGDPYPETLIPHYNVLRKLVLGVSGEELVNGTWAKDQTISRSYSFKLDSANWAAENCNIVVYVDKKAEMLNHSEIQQAILQAVTWPAGIDQPEAGFFPQVTLYPNPSRDESTVRINLKVAGNIRLCLINSMGSEVTVPANFFFSPGIHDIPVHTAGLAPGLYSLLIQGHNEKGIYKMIIR